MVSEDKIPDFNVNLCDTTPSSISTCSNGLIRVVEETANLNNKLAGSSAVVVSTKQLYQPESKSFPGRSSPSHQIALSTLFVFLLQLHKDGKLLYDLARILVQVFTIHLVGWGQKILASCGCWFTTLQLSSTPHTSQQLPADSRPNFYTDIPAFSTPPAGECPILMISAIFPEASLPSVIEQQMVPDIISNPSSTMPPAGEWPSPTYTTSTAAMISSSQPCPLLLNLRLKCGSATAQ